MLRAVRAPVVGARIAVPTCDRGGRVVADEPERAARALALGGGHDARHERGVVHGLDLTDGVDDGWEHADRFVR